MRLSVRIGLEELEGPTVYRRHVMSKFCERIMGIMIMINLTPQ